MRTIKITIAGLAAAGTLAAIALGAATASATIAPLSKFVVSPKLGRTLPVKIKGVGVGPQVFVFKKFTVTCQVAKIHGEATSAESETIALMVTYKECSGGLFNYGNIRKVTLPVRFKEKASLVYHYGGWIESDEEIEMVTKYLKCITDWDEGTYPEQAEEKPLNLFTAATYKTEEVPNANEKLYPNGKQKKLLITNEVKSNGIEWEEEGGGACEGEEITLSEGESGKYFGKLLVEVPNGNVEFKEPV
jgi:hypothetical protein